MSVCICVYVCGFFRESAVVFVCVSLRLHDASNCVNVFILHACMGACLQQARVHGYD